MIVLRQVGSTTVCLLLLGHHPTWVAEELYWEMVIIDQHAYSNKYKTVEYLHSTVLY